MNSFRFPLQKALEWRHTQLEIEEARFKQHAAALEDLDRAMAELEAAGTAAEIQVRGSSRLAGLDLTALSAFRSRVQNSEKELARRRAECRQKLDVQRAAMLEARRNFRLLERLKERRLAEWRAAHDKQIDDAATELYLGRWQRERKAG